MVLLQLKEELRGHLYALMQLLALALVCMYLKAELLAELREFV